MNNEKDIEKLMTELAQERECIRCGRHYREIDNIGTWKCSMHPGTFLGVAETFDTKLYGYTCCNKGYRTPGCTAVDHTDDAKEPLVIKISVRDAVVVFGDRNLGPGVQYSVGEKMFYINRRQPRRQL